MKLIILICRQHYLFNLHFTLFLSLYFKHPRWLSLPIWHSIAQWETKGQTVCSTQSAHAMTWQTVGWVKWRDFVTCNYSFYPFCTINYINCARGSGYGEVKGFTCGSSFISPSLSLFASHSHPSYSVVACVLVYFRNESRCIYVAFLPPLSPFSFHLPSLAALSVSPWLSSSLLLLSLTLSLTSLHY